MVKLFANICHVEIIATERSFTCDVKKLFHNVTQQTQKITVKQFGKWQNIVIDIPKNALNSKPNQTKWPLESGALKIDNKLSSCQNSFETESQSPAMMQNSKNRASQRIYFWG